MLGPLGSLLEDWDLDLNLELTAAVTNNTMSAAAVNKRPQLHRYLSEGHDLLQAPSPVRRSATMAFVRPRRNNNNR